MSYRINVSEGTANTMKLTILGATGATGTALTGQALAAGHEVTAIVRDPARLAVPAHPRLRTVTADVMDPASIAPAIDGADAVLSAVGPRGTGPTTVIGDSVHSIIQAMRKTGTRRFLQVSGSVVADEGESPYLRYLLSRWPGAHSCAMSAPTCAAASRRYGTATWTGRSSARPR